MRNQKVFLLAAIVLMSSSIAGADLILTLNGNDLSDSPLIQNLGELLVAVEGTTQIEPNDVSVSTVGGVLEPVPDANHEYYFEFDAELNEATIDLITNVDVVIDGNSISAGTKIYELWLYCNREQNILAACGMPLEDLIPPEGKSGSEPNDNDGTGETDKHDSGIATQGPIDLIKPAIPYFEKKAREKAEHLISCPNNIDAFLQTPDFNRTNLDALLFPSKDSERTFTMVGEGGGVMTMGMDGVIDVNSDITTNQVWTADNTYHVVADVNVQALLVIEPGTVIKFAADKGLFVNSGGTLISCGTPDNPVIYTSDSSTPGYADYYCPIFIEETASVSTKVTYSYIEYAYAGIVVLNKRLDAAIENNYFYNNVYGVVEQGTEHTDICNNLIISSYYSGIEVFLESTSGQADANSYILIQNNTCDYYQDCGITVHGVPDSNDAGLVVLANNSVSESYQYGLNLVDDYMYAFVLHTGYYGNTNNKNWEFEETNPVIETQWPYQNGTGWLPICYLDQDCNFIDAGAGLVDETGVVGLTTDVNSVPDSNITDIGFHYCHWSYTNAGEGNFLAGDLNHDWHTDFKDFAILGKDWHTSYDFNDVAALAQTWLLYGGPRPNIVPSFDQDPNDVSGDLGMTITVPDPNINRVFVMLDGERYGEFGDLFETPTFILETNPYLNGTHSIKIVYLYDDLVICSQPVQIVFNNGISVFRGNDGFTPGEDYHLYGIGSGTYRVQVEDIVNESIVYSQTFADNIEVHIDANSFSEEYGLYEIDVDKETLLLTVTWQDVVEKVIGREFKKEDFKPNCPIKMVISIGSKDLEKSKEKCWKACVKAAVRKRIWPVFLNAKACTWDNLSYCLSLNNVKMWYHVAHGNHKLWWQPPRQCISTASGLVFSYLKKDFDPNHIPPDYEKLSRRYEKCHSIPELGLIGSSKMIWVQFNACYSAHTTEFPKKLGILPIKDPMHIGEQLFVGWKGPALASDILGKYNQFEEDYWDYLRQGYTLGDAVDYSLPPAGGTRIRENFMYYGVIDWQSAWFRYPEIN